MDPLVVVMVLTAALMHAVWNTFIKIGDDRFMSMAVVIGVAALLAPALIAAGDPPARESWKFLVMTMVIHSAYYVFLI